MAKIHPTAIVSPDAKLADSVEVGPYTIIEEDVTIGAGTILRGQCRIGAHTIIGENNDIYQFAAIGTDPQDYAYDPTKISYTRIGDNNRFREGVTVNRGTKEGTETVIGNGCFLMANTHVGHNCRVGNNVIMVVNACLGGYSQIGDKVLLSGQTAVHQFCRVGRMAVLSGVSAVSMDLPPFMIAIGRNDGVHGFNIVGMRRNGFSRETIRAIKDVYDICFRQHLNMKNALEKIRKEVPLFPEVQEFIDFVESSERGVLPGCYTKSAVQE